MAGSSLFGSPARAPQQMTASRAAVGINPQAIQQVKQAMGVLRGLSNPKQMQQALAQAAQQSPMLSSTLQMCQGRPPQEVFAEQCRQHGVNPDEAAKTIFGMLS